MFDHLNTRIPKRIEQEKEKVSVVLIPLIKKTVNIISCSRSVQIISHTSPERSVFQAARENLWKLPYRQPFVKHVKNFWFLNLTFKSMVL